MGKCTIVVELCWGMLAGRYCLVPRLERTENGQILQALRVSTIEHPPHHVFWKATCGVELKEGRPVSELLTHHKLFLPD